MTLQDTIVQPGQEPAFPDFAAIFVEQLCNHHEQTAK
jgi:hypothetical protein